MKLIHNFFRSIIFIRIPITIFYMVKFKGNNKKNKCRRMQNLNEYRIQYYLGSLQNKRKIDKGLRHQKKKKNMI